MKFFVLAGLLVVAVNATLFEEHSAQFKSFKLKHGKTYMNQVEEAKRFAIFRDNLRSIEEHNALYEQGKVSYKEAVNKFSDMTPEEFKASLNLHSDPIATLNSEMYVRKGVSVPESVDWRTDGQVSDVKNQGDCGSCWAFAISGTTEAAYYRKTGTLVSLSAQQMVDCDTTSAGCNGGFIEKSFPYVIENGLESEDSYPYTAVNGTCNYDSSAVVTKVSNYTALSGSEVDLLEAVATVGPVATTMDGSLLAYYSSGIFFNPYCEQQDANHAVLIVGYGIENEEAYWLVKNSWGSDWGEDGYFRIIRNYNLCGIGKGAVYPTID